MTGREALFTHAVLKLEQYSSLKLSSPSDPAIIQHHFVPYFVHYISLACSVNGEFGAANRRRDEEKEPFRRTIFRYDEAYKKSLR